jgi:hypothetical protein
MRVPGSPPINICDTAWPCSYELSVLKDKAIKRIICPSTASNTEY